MCGIAGALSMRGAPRAPRDLATAVEAMAHTMRHRGPDDAGAWASDDGLVALAHRRLSIVDLSPRGRNPMFRDGRRLAITFNGEIYNFRELRPELEARGHRFETATDTEVILAAYDAWGLNAIDRFAGMFAFALWDAPRRRLWIARDRLGKKPLYYAHHNGWLTFASELKGLLADPAFPREIDPTALQLYLRYGYVPAPLSIFRAARKLEPGHYLVCENGRTTLTRYWDPLDYVRRDAAPLDDRDAEEALEARLRTAVAQRQIADVPLGAFLSGGIDSSLVVALMQEAQTSPVKTFSIRFTDPAFNEADHAAAVARHLGTEHHEETCDERHLLEIAARIPDIFDEPFGDSSAIPTFLVSRTARRHVTVALSGDGGDELFFGYPRYQYHADASWALGLPRPARRLAAAAASRMPARRLRRIADVLSDDDDDAYGRFVGWLTTSDIEALSRRAVVRAPLYDEMLARLDAVPSPDRPPLLDLVTYLPDDILAKVDRTSMAVSLEVRAPLLDHRVVELALGLPQRLKRRDGQTKWLLRRLLYRRVPPELVERPKMGFGVPLARWFRGPLRAQMDALCGGSALESVGLDPAPARRMWRDFTAGGYHRPDLLWQIFVLAAWAERFIVQPSEAVSTS
jgi:asparagine synthase (glutamine-hydrolysing)